MTNLKARLIDIGCITALAAVAASPLLAQQNLGREGTSWRWDGVLPAGGSVRVFSINGALHFSPSSDANVHVRAEKHVHSGGDPRAVHYAVVRDGNNLVICAMWNDDATCDASGLHSNNSDETNDDRRRNVGAEIAVQLPSGAQMSGNTVNGEVTVDRLDSDIRVGTVNGTIGVTNSAGAVRARTVNGNVNIETRGGPVSAETVNGSINASMGSTGNTDIRFRTVSGSIDITVPGTLNADVQLNTLNGSVNSKFPLDFDRDRHRARGVVGSSGRRLTASTVNGSITLH